MSRGRFIVLEGPDGVSKSTQAVLTVSSAGVITFTPTYTGTYAAGETVVYLNATWYR